MPPLRLIIVGLGARAQMWLRVLDADPDVKILALCDPDRGAQTRAREKFPDIPIGKSFKDVFTTEAEAVLLCTPPSGRENDIELACVNGLAILAEKPLSDNVSEAARFVAKADAVGVPLIVGLNFRYLNVTQTLRNLLREGAVGQAEFGRFTYERWRDGNLSHMNSYPMKMKQPMLWEQSIHHFDLMRFVYGLEPIKVRGHTFNPSWSMYADDANVSAIIDFQDNLTVNYQGTWAGSFDRLDFDWRTDCTAGIVHQRSMFGDLIIGHLSDSKMKEVSLNQDIPWVTDITALARMFVKLCRGTGPQECTGRDHLQSLYMVEACILSSDRETAVEIEEIASIAERVQK